MIEQTFSWPFCPNSRVSREAALDINTEQSQSEQIVWDDPTAREERAKLADNLQWPGSPSQHFEPHVPPHPPTVSELRDSMTDSELVEMGKRSAAHGELLCSCLLVAFTVQGHK